MCNLLFRYTRQLDEQWKRKFPQTVTRARKSLPVSGMRERCFLYNTLANLQGAEVCGNGMNPS